MHICVLDNNLSSDMSSHVCPSHHLLICFPIEDHKCEIGITSKRILDGVNTIIIQNMQINKWKNTPQS